MLHKVNIRNVSAPRKYVALVLRVASSVCQDQNLLFICRIASIPCRTHKERGKKILSLCTMAQLMEQDMQMCFATNDLQTPLTWIQFC